MARHDADARDGNGDALNGIGSDYSVEASQWRRYKQ